jgi:hypothetical protein
MAQFIIIINFCFYNINFMLKRRGNRKNVAEADGLFVLGSQKRYKEFE